MTTSRLGMGGLPPAVIDAFVAGRMTLADLAAKRHPGRRTPDEITLFKSVGSALEDLCAARLVFERCG